MVVFMLVLVRCLCLWSGVGACGVVLVLVEWCWCLWSGVCACRNVNACAFIHEA